MNIGLINITCVYIVSEIHTSLSKNNNGFTIMRHSNKLSLKPSCTETNKSNVF